jgi:hypothetical protein
MVDLAVESGEGLFLEAGGFEILDFGAGLGFACDLDLVAGFVALALRRAMVKSWLERRGYEINDEWLGETGLTRKKAIEINLSLIYVM